MFNKGDEVRIVKKVEHSGWQDEMDDFVGHEGVVKYASSDPAVYVEEFDDYWWFPGECLELVE